MPTRRMLSKTIIDTDDFHKLSIGARWLYCMLVLHADDDGFVGNPTCIMHTEGVQMCELGMLIHGGYVIPLENGLTVVADWNEHNHVPPSKYTPSLYLREKQQLGVDENNRYFLLSNDSSECTSYVCNTDKFGDPGKDRLGQVSIYGMHASRYATGDTQNKGRPSSIREVSEYIEEKKYHIDPKNFYSHYEAIGWKKTRGGPIADWKAMVDYWERNRKSENHNAPSYDSEAFKQKAKTVSEYPNQNELLERIEDKADKADME